MALCQTAPMPLLTVWLTSMHLTVSHTFRVLHGLQGRHTVLKECLEFDSPVEMRTSQSYTYHPYSSVYNGVMPLRPACWVGVLLAEGGLKAMSLHIGLIH